MTVTPGLRLHGTCTCSTMVVYYVEHESLAVRVQTSLDEHRKNLGPEGHPSQDTLLHDNTVW